MKLFSDFYAVKFPEENLLFVTRKQSLHYIYSFDQKIWHKYQKAGNNSIHIDRYPDVSREELKAAMGGILPTRESDFYRLCDPSQLWSGEMMTLLCEDYPDYLSRFSEIFNLVEHFLCESDVKYHSYQKIRELFQDARSTHQGKEELPERIQRLSFTVLGRDIYAEQIKIIDGHNGFDYFWIQPVRIIDDTDTDNMDNVAELKSAEISICEDDVNEYLTPFLYKYFDPELDANKKRSDAIDFDWNLTYNYYTYESVSNILRDIRAVIDALSAEKPCEAVDSEWLNEHSANSTLIIDFFKRFIYRMEYMMAVGKEKGYDLISFMGP